MKLFLLSLLMVVSVAAKEVKSEIRLQVTSGGLLSTTIIGHVLGFMGFKVSMHRISSAEGAMEMDMTLSGKQPFDPKKLSENLREHRITVQTQAVKSKQWVMGLDASTAVWNVPPITEDEGAQIERTAAPSWFMVRNAPGITIESPYGHLWYPEIAILDDQMHPLVSLRETEPKERMTFALPEHAMYLKVSNLNGMKMLREGMWIESANSEE